MIKFGNIKLRAINMLVEDIGCDFQAYQTDTKFITKFKLINGVDSCNQVIDN